MAKLVVLSPEQKGRSYELKVDKTTIGRVEDNTFQITDPSVSSHHCEILLRGTDVVIKDLNSTNGSFINGEKVSESVLKPGQTLRLGQIELCLESDSTITQPALGGTTAPALSSSTTTSVSKRQLDQTVVMKRGVSLDELEQGTRTSGFDTSSKGFSKKSNKTNKWFLIGGIIVVVIVAIVFFIILAGLKK